MLIKHFLSPVKNTNQKLTGAALGFFPGWVGGGGRILKQGQGMGGGAWTPSGVRSWTAEAGTCWPGSWGTDTKAWRLHLLSSPDKRPPTTYCLLQHNTVKPNFSKPKGKSTAPTIISTAKNLERTTFERPLNANSSPQHEPHTWNVAVLTAWETKVNPNFLPCFWSGLTEQEP